MKQIFIAYCVALLFLAPATGHCYSSLPSVSAFRTLPATAGPGEPVTVRCSIVTDAGLTSGIRGFFFSDQIDNRLSSSLELIGLYMDYGEPVIEAAIEQGAANEIYSGATPFRIILETPPDFPENKILTSGSELVIEYSLTVPFDAAAGTRYTFPGFCWGGFLMETEEAVFGFEDSPSVELQVESTATVGQGGSYSTISQGISAVAPGGTVYVLAGTYDGFAVPVTKTGITVQAAPGAAPVINGAPVGSYPDSAAVLIEADYASVSGLTIGAVTATYGSAVMVDNATGVHLNFNNINCSGAGFCLNNRGGAVVDARNNYWGADSADDIASVITGTADYEPYLSFDFSGSVETAGITDDSYSVDILNSIDLSVGVQGAVTMTFAAYGAAPFTGSGFGPGSSYFDMFAFGTDTTEAITMTMCAGVDAGSQLIWHDGLQWMGTDPPAVYSGGCLSFILDSSSSPSLSDLSGTVFGVGSVPAADTTTSSAATTSISGGGGGGGGGSGTGSVSTTTSSVPPAPPPGTSSTTTVEQATTAVSSSSTTSSLPQPVPPSILTIVSLPDTVAAVGHSYNYQIEAQGGKGYLTFSLQQCPAGMRVDSKGLISWRPTVLQAGTCAVHILVQDSEGQTAEQQYMLTVKPFDACPAELIIDKQQDLSLLRRFRDTLLLQSSSGRDMIDLYSVYHTEINAILLRNAELRISVSRLLQEVLPEVKEAVETGQPILLSPKQFTALSGLLENIKTKASPELEAAVSSLQKQLSSGALSNYVQLRTAQ